MPFFKSPKRRVISPRDYDKYDVVENHRDTLWTVKCRYHPDFTTFLWRPRFQDAWGGYMQRRGFTLRWGWWTITALGQLNLRDYP